ncbi:tetratricopeptide repeat protein [Gardnerella vaginalis]|uniref:tetratricopeptide repeat protein n=1 Tax=Gardnerella vaginalis TaxID=2702 RepID=UPI0015E0BC1A|nr:hypothetical protein [Gardnerella vaginalis]
MGEERGSRSGKSFGNRGHFSRQNGGKNGGNGEHRGGFHKGGFHKDGGRKFNHRDGERRFEHNDRRYDDHKNGRRDDFERDSGSSEGLRRNGFHKGGFNKSGFKKDNDRRFNHRDNDHRFNRDDHDNRSDRRFDRKDNHETRRNRGFDAKSEENGNPRYKKFDRDNRGERNDRRFEDNRGGFHKGDFKKNDSRKRDSKSSFRFENGPRRNSDGTVSYPSQNPYTDRRPGEPKMPKGLEYSMLSKESRERLRGLSKEHSENIGLHILAAYALQEEDPELALEHAKWAAKQASRIDFSRETLGFIAYRQGDYKLAAREFRTAMRMNGYMDYLPFIADCERGMGNLDKALEICMSDEARRVTGEVKAEMFLVYAGVLADTNHSDKAIELVHAMGRSKGLPGEYRMRAVQAEQYFLEEAGRSDEAIELDSLLDRLEEQYADIEDEENPEDVVIDYDLEHLNDAIMDEVGISEDDAQFAPDDDLEDDSDDSYDSYDSDDDSQIADNTETIEMSAVKSKEE